MHPLSSPRKLFAVLLLIAATTTAATAEVIVTIHHEPFDLAARSRAPLESGAAEPSTRSVTSALGTPSGLDHFVIWYEVDTTKLADSTLWAVRNEGPGDAMIEVEYFDVQFVEDATEMFTIAENGVQSRNIRDVVGLAPDPDGFARGFVRIKTDNPISMDTFQIDFANDFATGGVAFDASELCTNWTARFLRFGAGAGTVLNVLANGPLGMNGNPTLRGNVYDESGAFINSFTVRTDDWAFEIAVHDFVLGGVNFGSLELALDTAAGDDGLVAVNHPALGKFSIGNQGICIDATLP